MSHRPNHDDEKNNTISFPTLSTTHASSETDGHATTPPTSKQQHAQKRRFQVVNVGKLQMDLKTAKAVANRPASSSAQQKPSAPEEGRDDDGTPSNPNSKLPPLAHRLLLHKNFAEKYGGNDTTKSKEEAEQQQRKNQQQQLKDKANIAALKRRRAMEEKSRQQRDKDAYETILSYLPQLLVLQKPAVHSEPVTSSSSGSDVDGWGGGTHTDATSLPTPPQSHNTLSALLREVTSAFVQCGADTAILRGGYHLPVLPPQVATPVPPSFQPSPLQSKKSRYVKNHTAAIQSQSHLLQRVPSSSNNNGGGVQRALSNMSTHSSNRDMSPPGDPSNLHASPSSLLQRKRSAPASQSSFHQSGSRSQGGGGKQRRVGSPQTPSSPTGKIFEVDGRKIGRGVCPYTMASLDQNIIVDGGMYCSPREEYGVGGGGGGRDASSSQSQIFKHRSNDELMSFNNNSNRGGSSWNLKRRISGDRLNSTKDLKASTPAVTNTTTSPVSTVPASAFDVLITALLRVRKVVKEALVEAGAKLPDEASFDMDPMLLVDWLNQLCPLVVALDPTYRAPSAHPPPLISDIAGSRSQSPLASQKRSLGGTSPLRTPSKTTTNSTAATTAPVLMSFLDELLRCDEEENATLSFGHVVVTASTPTAIPHLSNKRTTTSLMEESGGGGSMAINNNSSNDASLSALSTMRLRMAKEMLSMRYDPKLFLSSPYLALVPPSQESALEATIPHALFHGSNNVLTTSTNNTSPTTHPNKTPNTFVLLQPTNNWVVSWLDFLLLATVPSAAAWDALIIPRLQELTTITALSTDDNTNNNVSSLQVGGGGGGSTTSSISQPTHHISTSSPHRTPTKNKNGGEALMLTLTTPPPVRAEGGKSPMFNSSMQVRPTPLKGVQSPFACRFRSHLSTLASPSSSSAAVAVGHEEDGNPSLLNITNASTTTTNTAVDAYTRRANLALALMTQNLPLLLHKRSRVDTLQPRRVGASLLESLRWLRKADAERDDMPVSLCVYAPEEDASFDEIKEVATRNISVHAIRGALAEANLLSSQRHLQAVIAQRTKAGASFFNKAKSSGVRIGGGRMVGLPEDSHRSFKRSTNTKPNNNIINPSSPILNPNGSGDIIDVGSPVVQPQPSPNPSQPLQQPQGSSPLLLSANGIATLEEMSFNLHTNFSMEIPTNTSANNMGADLMGSFAMGPSSMALPPMTTTSISPQPNIPLQQQPTTTTLEAFSIATAQYQSGIPVHFLKPCISKGTLSRLVMNWTAQSSDAEVALQKYFKKQVYPALEPQRSALDEDRIKRSWKTWSELFYPKTKSYRRRFMYPNITKTLRDKSTGILLWEYFSRLEAFTGRKVWLRHAFNSTVAMIAQTDDSGANTTTPPSSKRRPVRTVRSIGIDIESLTRASTPPTIRRTLTQNYFNKWSAHHSKLAAIAVLSNIAITANLRLSGWIRKGKLRLGQKGALVHIRSLCDARLRLHYYSMWGVFHSNNLQKREVDTQLAKQPVIRGADVKPPITEVSDNAPPNEGNAVVSGEQQQRGVSVDSDDSDIAVPSRPLPIQYANFEHVATPSVGELPADDDDDNPFPSRPSNADDGVGVIEDPNNGSSSFGGDTTNPTPVQSPSLQTLQNGAAFVVDVQSLAISNTDGASRNSHTTTPLANDINDSQNRTGSSEKVVSVETITDNLSPAVSILVECAVDAALISSFHEEQASSSVQHGSSCDGQGIDTPISGRTTSPVATGAEDRTTSVTSDTKSNIFSSFPMSRHNSTSTGRSTNATRSTRDFRTPSRRNTAVSNPWALFSAEEIMIPDITTFTNNSTNNTPRLKRRIKVSIEEVLKTGDDGVDSNGNEHVCSTSPLLASLTIQRPLLRVRRHARLPNRVVQMRTEQDNNYEDISLPSASPRRTPHRHVDKPRCRNQEVVPSYVDMLLDDDTSTLKPTAIPSALLHIQVDESVSREVVVYDQKNVREALLHTSHVAMCIADLDEVMMDSQLPSPDHPNRQPQLIGSCTAPLEIQEVLRRGGILDEYDIHLTAIITHISPLLLPLQGKDPSTNHRTMQLRQINLGRGRPHHHDVLVSNQVGRLLSTIVYTLYRRSLIQWWGVVRKILLKRASVRQLAAKVYIPSMKGLIRDYYTRWQQVAQRKLAARAAADTLLIRSNETYRRLVFHKLLKFVMRRYHIMRQVMMSQAVYERYCTYTLQVYYAKLYSFLEMRLDADSVMSSVSVSPGRAGGRSRRVSIREDLGRSGETTTLMASTHSDSGRHTPVSPSVRSTGGERPTRGTFDRLQGSISSVQALYDAGRRTSQEGFPEVPGDSFVFGTRRESINN